MSSRARQDAPTDVSPSTRPVRVVLLDDDDGAREAVIDLLDAEPSVELVGSAVSAEGGIQLIGEAHPDVALVDVRIDGGKGDRATREALELSPDTKVVGLSETCDREAVLGMFRAGAIGFVDKSSGPEQIREVIHAATEGRAVVTPEIPGEIVVELAGRLEAEEMAERDSHDRRARIHEVLSDGDAMHVLFQPIFEISSTTIVGFEALMRFLAEPRRPPDEWFEEAGSVGLGTALEVESVRRALQHRSELPEGAYMAVNVSPETVSSVGLESVLDEVPAESVVLELTEHAVVRDYGTLKQALDRFRERGFRIAVDDAGAGYASLRHIVRLDPDIIKIDAELTSGIENDEKRRALATALISFANETDEAIVAEGVETAGELEALTALGVPFAQGFFLGRPAALSEQGPDSLSVLDPNVARRELRALAESWQGSGDRELAQVSALFPRTHPARGGR